MFVQCIVQVWIQTIFFFNLMNQHESWMLEGTLKFQKMLCSQIPYKQIDMR